MLSGFAALLVEEFFLGINVLLVASRLLSIVVEQRSSNSLLNIFVIIIFKVIGNKLFELISDSLMIFKNLIDFSFQKLWQILHVALLLLKVIIESESFENLIL